MGLTTSPSAAERIKTILEGKDTDTVRFGVRGGGCSGFSYLFDLEPNGPSEDDKVFEFDGFRVAVDKKSYFFINGTEIDWVEEMIGSRFEFRNPNVASACGCGESVSFEVEDE